MRVGLWHRNVLLIRLSGLLSHRRRRTFVGNARGVSRVTAAATHDWLGYDMAPCKFYEGRAAVTTSSSETKPDYLGGLPRHLHPPPRLRPRPATSTMTAS